jgi:hypothetical protein
VRSYEGPPLPAEQIATLHPSSSFNVVSKVFTNVLRLDGREVKGRAVLEVLPGEHTILVGASFFTSNRGTYSVADQLFQIDAQAGHGYRLEANASPVMLFGENPSDFDFTFWVEDDATGDIVAEEVVVQGISPAAWKHPIYRSRFGDDQDDRDMPTWAFETPGGSVRVRMPLLVTRGRDAWLWVDVENRTTASIRVDAQISFPPPRVAGNVVTWGEADKQLADQEEVHGIHVIDPGESWRFEWALARLEFGAQMPMAVAVSRDGEAAETLGELRTDVMFGAAGERVGETVRSVLDRLGDESGLMLVGFPPNVGELEPPGTNAGQELRSYAANKLFREQSKIRNACAYEVLGATPVATWSEATLSSPLPSSVILAEGGEELQWASAIQGGVHARFALEIWRIKSCGVESSYEVLFVGGYEHDAHVIVQRLL